MKLKKINVRNFVEVLTDNELKNVVGGGYDGMMYCVYTNSAGETFDSNCIHGLNGAIALCQFWWAAGCECRCVIC